MDEGVWGLLVGGVGRGDDVVGVEDGGVEVDEDEEASEDVDDEVGVGVADGELLELESPVAEGSMMSGSCRPKSPFPRSQAAWATRKTETTTTRRWASREGNIIAARSLTGSIKKGNEGRGRPSICRVENQPRVLVDGTACR